MSVLHKSLSIPVILKTRFTVLLHIISCLVYLFESWLSGYHQDGGKTMRAPRIHCSNPHIVFWFKTANVELIGMVKH